MTEYRAGSPDDFKETGRLLLKCGDAEIGIFLVDGECPNRLDATFSG